MTPRRIVGGAAKGAQAAALGPDPAGRDECVMTYFMCVLHVCAEGAMMCGECRGLVAYGAIWCERTVRVCLRVRVCSERPPQAPVCGEWACGREREARMFTWCYNVECVCARPRAATERPQVGGEARPDSDSGRVVGRGC